MRKLPQRRAPKAEPQAMSRVGERAPSTGNYPIRLKLVGPSAIERRAAQVALLRHTGDHIAARDFRMGAPATAPTPIPSTRYFLEIRAVARLKTQVPLPVFGATGFEFEHAVVAVKHLA